MDADHASRDDLRIFPEEAARLGPYYVYILRDPRDSFIFYVGKGTGTRVLAHRADPVSTSKKVARIGDIEVAGLDVERLFVRTNIDDEDQALMVEQALIDVLRASDATAEHLTNIAAGHGSHGYGIARVDARVKEVKSLPSPPFPRPCIVFNINNSWRPGIGDHDLELATTGVWEVAERVRRDARVVFGVAHHVIRSVYRVGGLDAWDYCDTVTSNTGVPRKKYRARVTKDQLLWDQYVGTHVRELIPRAYGVNKRVFL